MLHTVTSSTRGATRPRRPDWATGRATAAAALRATSITPGPPPARIAHPPLPDLPIRWPAPHRTLVTAPPPTTSAGDLGHLCMRPRTLTGVQRFPQGEVECVSCTRLRHVLGCSRYRRGCRKAGEVPVSRYGAPMTSPVGHRDRHHVRAQPRFLKPVCPPAGLTVNNERVANRYGEHLRSEAE